MTDNEGISAPRPLDADDEVSSFQSGIDSLDHWLRKKALANQVSGASRTYVICSGGRIVGYFALAAGAVAQRETTGAVRRNMPDPIPVMVLARLAVDTEHQGLGLGSALLRDALMRAVQAADVIGIRAILVHAISDDARAFYERHGFRPSPIDAMTLMITIHEARLAMERAGT